MRKYIFPKKMLVLCLSRVSRVCFPRYPFSCHVVPFPLFRPSLTRVYEKQLFLDTFCWKKHCIGNVRHAKVHFPKMLVLCLSRVSRVFSSRYPFSCHVVPFPLFRPSLTRVYEKQLFLDTFCWKKHCIGNLRHAKVHFPKKCSFYVFLVFLVFFFSVPILVPCRSVSVVPAIVNSCLWKTTISWYFLLKKTLYRQRQTYESTFSPKMLVLCLSRVYRIFFSRYPFSSHGVLLVSTHTVSRALRFLMFNVFSVLLLSFYLVLCLSRVSRVFFSVPVLVPCRSVSVVPAIVNLCLWKKTIFWYFLLKKHCIGNVRHAKVHFSQKMVLIPQKCTGTFLTFWKKCTGTFLTYQNGGKCTVHFWRSPPLKGWGCCKFVLLKNHIFGDPRIWFCR